MKPEAVTQAITNSFVQGGSQWLISTIVAFLPVLWTMALMFHLGRPYVLRTLRRIGLRLALLLITFALGWIFFNPNTVFNQALPITAPIAELCLLLALAVKLSRRVDDDVNAYRLSTVFLVLGATLYYGPLVFAVEATSQTYLAGFGAAFTSNANPTAALWIMWLSLLGVALVTGWLFVQAVRSASRSMARRLAQKETKPASAGR